MDFNLSIDIKGLLRRKNVLLEIHEYKFRPALARANFYSRRFEFSTYSLSGNIILFAGMAEQFAYAC